MRNRITKITLVAAAAAGIIGAGAAVAIASPSHSATPSWVTGDPIVGCVNAPHPDQARPYSYVPWRGVWRVYTGHGKDPRCPAGSWQFSAASEQQLSSVARQVQANTGTGQLSTHKLAYTPASPAVMKTGGTFKGDSRRTDIGEITGLPAGTYLLVFHAKVTPDPGYAGTAQVFPQFMVYNGPGPSAGCTTGCWGGELAHFGAAPLEPAGSGHDSFYGGTAVVTVGAGDVLHVYAHGYDSDSSGGTYLLDSASVQFVRAG